MLFQSVPRGSIVATLTAADLCSRLESYPQKTPELRLAVTKVCQYMLNPCTAVTDREFEQWMQMTQVLFYE